MINDQNLDIVSEQYEWVSPVILPPNCFFPYPISSIFGLAFCFRLLATLQPLPPKADFWKIIFYRKLWFSYGSMQNHEKIIFRFQ